MAQIFELMVIIMQKKHFSEKDFKLLKRTLPYKYRYKKGLMVFIHTAGLQSHAS